MEWLVEASEMMEWAREIASVLDVMLSFIGAVTVIYGVIYGGYKIWHRCRDRRRRVDALFATPSERPGPNSAPSRFLWEEFQFVGFRGREKEVEELTDWACRKAPSGKNVSIALITGGPGRGKSRLARHLCGLAEKWGSGNWIIGFLKKGAGDEEQDDFLLLMKKRKPVLVVIDYAEHRTEQVKKFVSVAFATDRRKYPMRVLLIARAKNEGWWSGLEEAFDNYSPNPFEDGQAKLLELAPIEDDPDVTDRSQEFNHALRAFRKALGKDREGETPEDGIPNDLSSQVQKMEVLDIHVAALLAAYGDDDDDSGAGQTDIEKKLFAKLVKREQKAWDQAIENRCLGLKGTSVQRAIAWLATTDGLTCEADAVQRLLLLPDFGAGTPERQQGVAEILPELYPGGEGKWWGGMAPDRLTAWLTCELDDMIENDKAKQQPTVVAGLPDDALTNLLRHLTWRAQRYESEQDEQALAAAIHAGGWRGIDVAAGLGAEIGDPVGIIASKILSKTKDVYAARKVLVRVGAETVSLRELALAATEILHRNATNNEERATYANILSIHLFSLDRREEALAVIKEAVAIRRELAEARPDSFRPGLAASLGNLSNCLSGLGHREDALAAIEETVAIQRELAEVRSDALHPDLAKSLSNLGACLSALGRHEKALAVTEKAVAICRELAEARPDAFRPNLAESLNGLSNCLSGLGRREDALAAVEEAAALCRELAEARPHAFRPNLAGSLNRLGNCLSDLGRHEEALAAIEEAVILSRGLAKARPAVFRPDLATSLNNLSRCLSTLGRHEGALVAIEKAAALHRELAEARPDAFRPNLAANLSNLGACLYRLGHREEALAAIKEAVALCRGLVEARPDTFRLDLARGLNNLSAFLSDLGRPGDALVVSEEAVALYRELAKARPNAFRPDLATTLNNLGNCLAALGRREDALAAVEEAAALHRELAEARPAVFHPDLATSLNNLSNCQAALGHREDALTAIEEAVVFCRGLAEIRPDLLATSLRNMGACLADLGRCEEALVVIEESVAIRRELAGTWPDRFRPDLAKSLVLLSVCLSKLGRHEEASKAIEEANNLV